jgi:hypothetical protein
MPSNIETTMIVDEAGIEILASWLRTRDGIELLAMEMVIAGKGIEIRVDDLDQKQYSHICEEIDANQ